MEVTKRVPGQDDILRQVIAWLPKSGKIVDIGTGCGLAARRFVDAGWDVTATGFEMDAYLGDEPLPASAHLLHNVDITDMQCFEDGCFDAVWCAHVIEHVLDTGRALTEIRRILKPSGRLFISVPPFKHAVVGGHVSNGWNLGNLMYVLAVCGFDLSAGAFVKHGYNVFAAVGRGDGSPPQNELRFANGDLETLTASGRFPKGFEARQGFDGRLDSVNWEWTVTPTEIKVPRARLAHRPPIPKLRIAFLIPWITKGRGGTEGVGQMMANAMASRGHHVTILTFDDSRGEPLFELEPSIKLTHLGEADTDLNHQQMLLEIASWSPDVLVGLHMNRTFLRYVRCAGKLGIPLVLSEHAEPKDVFDRGTNSPAERELAFAAATRIHLVNPALKCDLPDYIQRKVIVIPNTAAPANDQSGQPKGLGRRLLLCVTRLVPRKNMDLLLRAFAVIADQVADWDLQIVGDGPEMGSLVAQASTLGIRKRIDFTGHRDDVSAFYRAADLFTLPSVSEVFGLVTLEAMAHGLPVVALRASIGASYLVEDGVTGILSSGSIDLGSYPGDLMRLMSNPELRAQMGQQGLQRYKTRFSPGVVEDSWEEMFFDAVEEYRPPGRPSRASYAASRIDDLVFGESSRIDSASQEA